MTQQNWNAAKWSQLVYRKRAELWPHAVGDAGKNGAALFSVASARAKPMLVPDRACTDCGVIVCACVPLCPMHAPERWITPRQGRLLDNLNRPLVGFGGEEFIVRKGQWCVCCQSKCLTCARFMAEDGHWYRWARAERTWVECKEGEHLEQFMMSVELPT